MTALQEFAGNRVSIFDVMTPSCARAWGRGLRQCGGIIDPATYAWDIDYDGSVEPPAATPAWPLTGVDHGSSSGGEFTIAAPGTDTDYYSQTPTAVASGKSVWYYTRQRVTATPGANTSWAIGRVYTGAHMVRLFFSSTAGAIYETSAATVFATGMDLTVEREYVIRITYSGRATVWVDGVLIFDRQAATTATLRADFGKTGTGSEAGSQVINRVAFATVTDVTLGAAPCYNRRASCQNAGAFSLTATLERFTTSDSIVPPGLAARRYIEKGGIRLIPTEIDLRRGIGVRDLMTVTMKDQADADDIASDPNITLRPARAGSTFMRKWLRRNPYYEGATCYHREGFKDAAGNLDMTAMTTRRYILDRIDGPASGGVYTWRCKDLLKLLDKADCPGATAAELAAAISTTGATSCTVKTGQGDLFGAPTFYFRVDDEIMGCTARTGDTFGTITRGQWNTTAATHAIDAKVQLCYVVTGTPDVVWAALLELAGVSASLIDTAGAATETTNWMTGWNLSACLTSPGRVSEVLAQVMQFTNCMTWWDAEAQLCRLRQVRGASPSETVTTLTDRANIISGSARVEPLVDLRITRATIFFGVIDWSQSLDDPSNYSRVVQSIEAAAEGTTQYNGVKDLVIYAWGMPSTMYNEAEAMAQRLTGNFRDAPNKVIFRVGPKDETVQVGSIVSLETDELVDDEGTPLPTQGIVLSKQRPQGSDNTEIVAATITSSMASGAFWTSETHPDWSAATPAERLYGFWTDDAGTVDGVTLGPTLL